MKNRKLFGFDFISAFTIFALILLALCINSLINIEYDNLSTNKSLLFAWIRVASSLLLSVTAITNLRSKRINESQN
jgi:hypothetical protein